MFESQLREQQQIVILQQSLASTNAECKSRLELSLYQRTGEQHRADEVMYRARADKTDVQRIGNEKSELSQHPSVSSNQIPTTRGSDHEFLETLLLTLNACLTERLRDALLDKLSNYNYRSTFSQACRKRHQGTGQWLFDCPEFQKWEQADVSCGLWVHGIRK